MKLLRLTCFVLMVLATSTPPCWAAESHCEGAVVRGDAEPDDLKGKLQTVLGEAVGTCIGTPQLTVEIANCKGPTATLELGGSSQPIVAQCTEDNKAVKVSFERSSFARLSKAEDVTLTINNGGEKYTLEGKTDPVRPQKKKPAEEGEGENEPKQEVSPVITPVNIDANSVGVHQAEHHIKGDECLGEPPPKYIYLHENLAVDPKSDKFVTDQDRVVVRVIARKAVICLYRVATSSENKAERDDAKIGGDTAALAKAIESMLKIAATSSSKAEDGSQQVTLCGESVTISNGQYTIPPDYTHTDFTFGPYSNTTIELTASRYDAKLKEAQLKEVPIKIENHRRYAGWLDFAVLGARVWGDELHVDTENGSELRRIRVEDARSGLDFAVLVKLFAFCTGKENGLFQAQDLSSGPFCIGLGGGFSVTHPTSRFYPIGLNLTWGKVSIHALTVLDEGRTLAGGLKNGDLFAGSKEELTTNDQLQWGAAFGIGLDPTLAGDLIGAIVGAL